MKKNPKDPKTIFEQKKKNQIRCSTKWRKQKQKKRAQAQHRGAR
jgi:hypothetical protein